MAQALLWSEPCQRSVQDCSWQILQDPYCSTTSTLLPPRNMSLKHSVTLVEAMRVTDEARLLTEAAPPFRVVHVNRAFLCLIDQKNNHPQPQQRPATEESGSSEEESLTFTTALITTTETTAATTSMIGKPVESFFHVNQVVGPPEDKQQNCLESVLALEDKTQLTCRIKAIPVLDRRRQEPPRQSASSSKQQTTPAYNSCLLSHVLIQVEAVSVEHAAVPPNRCPTPFARSASQESMNYHSESEEEEEENKIVRSVG
jgi:hypothetical protein